MSLLSVIATNFAPDDFGPGFDDPSTGVPGFVIVLFVFVLGGALITTIVKVKMARSMARESGMDENRATAMTLLTDDGLEATYLSRNLRPDPAAPKAPDSPRTAAERMTELKGLLEQGLITDKEYRARRSAIIESL